MQQVEMAESSKELLDQPSKPSLFKGLLLGRNDSVPNSQKKKNSSIVNERGQALTTEVPKSQVLGKVKDFLGAMAKANEMLELNAQGTSRSDYDIEVLDGNEQEHIEMDLVLGVADLQTPEAVAAAEATIGGFRPSAASTRGSYSDTYDDTDNNNDSDDQRLNDNKPGDKPNKRPKIVVLN